MAIRLKFLFLFLFIASIAPFSLGDDSQTPQTAESENSGRRYREETRVFKLRYLDSRQLADRISILYRGAASIQVLPGVGTVAVRGVPEIVTSIADLIRESDVPPPSRNNIELTFYLISTSEASAGESIPSQLNSVIEQLRRTFAYKTYSLLDKLLLRAPQGDGAEMNGSLPFPVSGKDKEVKAKYSLRIKTVELSAGKEAREIRMDDLSFHLNAPVEEASGKIDNNEISIATDIVVREGQMAVVGKTSADGSPNSVILVATARVLE